MTFGFCCYNKLCVPSHHTRRIRECRFLFCGTSARLPGCGLAVLVLQCMGHVGGSGGWARLPDTDAPLLPFTLRASLALLPTSEALELIQSSNNLPQGDHVAEEVLAGAIGDLARIADGKAGGYARVSGEGTTRLQPLLARSDLRRMGKEAALLLIGKASNLPPGADCAAIFELALADLARIADAKAAQQTIGSNLVYCKHCRNTRNWKIHTRPGYHAGKDALASFTVHKCNGKIQDRYTEDDKGAQGRLPGRGLDCTEEEHKEAGCVRVNV